MKFLVFGKNGQLGTEFSQYFEINNYTYLSLSKTECDITNFKLVEK